MATEGFSHGGEKKVEIAVDGDLSTDFESTVLVLKNQSGVAFDLAWSGTPVGDFGVSVSNTGGVDRWSELPLTDAVSAAGAPGNAMIEIATKAEQVKLTYTSTSGSGNLQCTAVAK